MTTKSRAGLLVWWISSTTQPLGTLPPYICAELRSLRGRPARNRLWVPDGIEFHGLEIPEADRRWDEIDPSAGGIVFLRADVALVRLTGEGRVTDTYLDLDWVSDAEVLARSEREGGR